MQAKPTAGVCYRCTAPACRDGRGFTLIELVVVMVIIGVMSAAVGLFVSSPVQGYLAQARRAALTDAADLALLRLSRDLRAALPNSVRVSGTGAIELLLTLDGDRYRSETPGGADDRLEAGTDDSAFNTLAPLGGGGAIPANARLAVYPAGLAEADPYTTAVLSPAGTSLAIAPITLGTATEYRLTLSPAHAFPFDSPSRRVFLVQGPVSYLCSGTRLLRYAGYALQPSQPQTEIALDALAAATLVTDRLEPDSCDFRYASNAARRNAVVRLALELSSEGERVRLLRQVHVNNSP